jgi:selenocysteine lyase/cysteine desulfurase
MYLAPELHARLQPVFAGWLSVKNSWNFFDYKLDFLETAQRYEIGTPNFLGIVGAEVATGILNEVNPLHIQDHLLDLGDKLIEPLSELGMTYIGSELKNERSGIYSFTGPDTENLFKFLTEQRIYLSLRNKALRFSPHFYNTEKEMQQIIECCQKYIRK